MPRRYQPRGSVMIAPRYCARYPLHPDLMDTLMPKTAPLENFQRVRGMLRVLVQQAYRHVFYPERGPWPDVPLNHATIAVTSASSEPGLGQKQVERVLRDAGELILQDDALPAPTSWRTKPRCGTWG